MLPAATYADYATADQKEYEGKPFGKDALGFPYDLSKYIGKDLAIAPIASAEIFPANQVSTKL